jgi:small subunit ribosomal protein S7
MPRRGIIAKREILPDPKYGSVLVTKLVNTIMKDGKKGMAFKIVYGAFDYILGQFQDRFASKVLDSNEAETSIKNNEEKLNEDKASSDAQKILVVLNKTLDHVRPTVEIRAQRVGGSVHQVPKPLTKLRGDRLALSFIKKGATDRMKNMSFKPGDKAMVKALALEIMDAYDNKGAAVKMRSDMHRQAKANQAYVFVRFSDMQELQ